MWRLLLSIAGLIGSLSPATLMADQIVLKNGDRITGSIVKQDGGNLTIKTDLLGTVTTAWDKVESVRADKPLHVVTKEGASLEGTLTTVNGSIEVASAAAKTMVPPSDIATLRNADEQRNYERLLTPDWGQLWTGNATLGWAGSQGNAQTLTFTTGLNAQRATRNDKTTIHFNTIKATAFSSGQNSLTAEAIRGGVAYDHNIRKTIFVNFFNDYEFDKFQNLDLRFVLGVGVGFHAFKTDRARLDLVGGSDFNRSSYSTPAITRTAEVYFGDDYNRKLGKAATFNQTARIFHDVNHSGFYRATFDSGTSVRITKWLNWNLSLSDRFVTPPAIGRKSNDVLYTTGLGFTFSR